MVSYMNEKYFDKVLVPKDARFFPPSGVSLILNRAGRWEFLRASVTYTYNTIQNSPERARVQALHTRRKINNPLDKRTIRSPILWRNLRNLDAYTQLWGSPRVRFYLIINISAHLIFLNLSHRMWCTCATRIYSCNSVLTISFIFAIDFPRTRCPPINVSLSRSRDKEVLLLNPICHCIYEERKCLIKLSLELYRNKISISIMQIILMVSNPGHESDKFPFGKFYDGIRDVYTIYIHIYAHMPHGA